VGVAVLLGGCSVWNASVACDVEPVERRVSERGDGWEWIGDPHASTVLADGRILVAWSSTDEGFFGATECIDGVRSEVRMALLDPATGRPIHACEGNVETIVSPAWDVAHSPSVAAVDIQGLGGNAAVAAIGWSVDNLNCPDRARVYIRYVNAAGCLNSTEAVEPVPSDVTGPVTGLSLAWSEPAHALLATFRSGREVLTAWLVDQSSTTSAETIVAADALLGLPAVALGPEGDGILAWGRNDDASTRDVVVQAVLLDPEGAVRPAVLAGGEAAPFRVDSPGTIFPNGWGFGLAVAAGPERVAIAFQSDTDEVGPPQMFLRELDARDGNPLASPQAPSGEAAAVDPRDGAIGASAEYLPDDSLLVLWDSQPENGTLGRLYGADGAPRFQSVSCDDGGFRVGARNGVGPASALVVGEDLWIFHAGEHIEDPVGSAVLGWTMPLSELWPGS
jgi:hypothetical protein